MYVRRRERDVQVDSPAKVNLFLEVLGRRDDGFHEIETLMLAVGIFDSVSVSPNNDGCLSLDARWALGAQVSASAGNWGDLPTGEDNLVIRALNELRNTAGIRSGATIQLRKRIPSAAGLGGASGNAAAALVAANLAWQLNWRRDQLVQIAARLGSDVPFFLGGDDGRLAAATCRGRGERIEAVDAKGGLHLVIVRPPEGLSTARVYAKCRPAELPKSARSLVDALRRGDPAAIGKEMMNRLEPAAEQLSPWIGRLRRRFDQLGLCGHQMSGSGTSYFGICWHAKQARMVAQRLRSLGLHAMPVDSIQMTLKL